MFWIARTGSPWRDLHDHFGKWSSVYRQFRRWSLSGVWYVLLAALNESGEGQDSVQMIDSTIVRDQKNEWNNLLGVLITMMQSAQDGQGRH